MSSPPVPQSSSRSQGVFHVLFCTTPLVVLPSGFVFLVLLPKIAPIWVSENYTWLVLYAARGYLLILTVIAAASLAATACTDPGRIPRAYHWIATANIAETRRGNSIRFSTTTAASAGSSPTPSSEIATFESVCPDSSFSPALHTSPHYGSRLCRELALSESAALLWLAGGGPRAPKASRLHLSAAAVRQWAAYLDPENHKPSAISMTPDEYRIDFDHSGLSTDLIAALNNVAVPLKWCVVCNHVRLPRTRHCRSCQSCVDRFDHHCVWVCNCIGLRNHRYFLCFVTSAFLLDGFITLCSITVFAQLWRDISGHSNAYIESNGFSRAETIARICAQLIGSHFGLSLITLLSLLLFLPLGNLVLFHLVLITTNRTTTEEMRELYLDRNPFDLGCCENLRWILWSAKPPSLVDRWGTPRVISGRGWKSRRGGALREPLLLSD